MKAVGVRVAEWNEIAADPVGVDEGHLTCSMVSSVHPQSRQKDHESDDAAVGDTQDPLTNLLLVGKPTRNHLVLLPPNPASRYAFPELIQAVRYPPSLKIHRPRESRDRYHEHQPLQRLERMSPVRGM